MLFLCNQGKLICNSVSVFQVCFDIKIYFLYSATGFPRSIWLHRICFIDYTWSHFYKHLQQLLCCKSLFTMPLLILAHHMSASYLSTVILQSLSGKNCLLVCLAHVVSWYFYILHKPLFCWKLHTHTCQTERSGQSHRPRLCKEEQWS